MVREAAASIVLSTQLACTLGTVIDRFSVIGQTQIWKRLDFISLVTDSHNDILFHLSTEHRDDFAFILLSENHGWDSGDAAVFIQG